MYIIATGRCEEIDVRKRKNNLLPSREGFNDIQSTN